MVDEDGTQQPDGDSDATGKFKARLAIDFGIRAAGGVFSRVGTRLGRGVFPAARRCTQIGARLRDLNPRFGGQFVVSSLVLWVFSECRNDSDW